MTKIYIKNVINNTNLDEFDKIISYYISHHNKKFDIYFSNVICK